MKYLALQFPGGSFKIDENDTGIFGPDWKLGASPGGSRPLSIADIINRLIPLIFVFASLILLAMLISGGFGIFLSGGNQEKIKKGQAQLTNALVGFLIIFAAYWIIQLLEFTFGLTIL